VLLRRIARPLFASWFVVEGLDALRHPAVHVEMARDGWRSLHSRTPAALHTALPVPVRTALEREPDARQLGMVVRAHGVALTGAALLLATGRSPRLAAFTLAALTAPLVVASLPDRRADGGDPVLRRQRRDRLVRSLTFTGGALLAAADLEGRPSLGWRVRHARAERATRHQDD